MNNVFENFVKLIHVAISRNFQYVHTYVRFQENVHENVLQHSDHSQHIHKLNISKDLQKIGTLNERNVLISRKKIININFLASKSQFDQRGSYIKLLRRS